MARGGGRGGRGGRGGTRRVSRGIRNATRSRNRTALRNRNRDNARARGDTDEVKRIDNEIANEIQTGFEDLATNIPASSNSVKRIGRKLSQAFRDRYKGGPNAGRQRLKNNTVQAKKELRAHAARQMESDFDELTSFDVPGMDANPVTKGGISNGNLNNGQRALLDSARGPMTAYARSGDVAGMRTFANSFDVIGGTLRELADAYQTTMDIAQTFFDQVNSDNN